MRLLDKRALEESVSIKSIEKDAIYRTSRKKDNGAREKSKRRSYIVLQPLNPPLLRLESSRFLIK